MDLFFFFYRFPHDYFILEYLIRDVYIPQNEIDKCVALLESNTSHFNVLGLYDTANQWFNVSGKGTMGMLIQINLSALKYMPENAVSFVMDNHCCFAKMHLNIKLNLHEILVSRQIDFNF